MAKESALNAYLARGTQIEAAMVSYTAALDQIAAVDGEVAKRIVNELADQRSHLKLIASENFSSMATQLAMGNLLTDKYSEGYPYHRFYAGCENVDAIEALACQYAKELFGAQHAYVQPHSGADANLVAYWAILSTRIQVPALAEMGITNPSDLSREDWDRIREKMGNQRLLALDYYSGGHLTHGYRQNVSAQMFDAYSYSVNKETGLLDYDEIERLANKIKPLILLAGYSAYPRTINFKRMSEIAKSVGAVFMVDMAHFAGLVAGKVFTGENNPVLWADVVTTTTHKTLRGPRGGMVLATEEFAESLDKGCPIILGGPLPHVMAAKAIALKEALDPSFEVYAKQIVANSKALAAACIKEGITVATGGSDNHLMLLDVRSFGLNGRQAEGALRECGVTLNRNSLPFDPNGPWYTSGLRIGTPALTTLGMGTGEMEEVAAIIALVLNNTKAAILTKGANAGKPSKAKTVTDEAVRDEARRRVVALLDRFPLYPELDLPFLQAHFS
ncbi:MAG TPA: glycine hydroxymethyltransferase [Sphaerochaeta sp.]|jgi:glycine hydroxymethyltransferase|nr:glycine hydroxymethyltransferase [Sphaerochaeta sp.]HPZ15794.1 glycine hydroxymethyltransferase [Sphaerochaeta sp.]